jgi:hypothetical protein
MGSFDLLLKDPKAREGFEKANKAHLTPSYSTIDCSV